MTWLRSIYKPKDIGVKFSIYGVLAMKRREKVECNRTELENGEEIGQIGEEGYKYLGILEKGNMLRKRWKKTLGKNNLKAWKQHWNQN